MLAGEQASLAVARIAVGVAGGLAPDADRAGFLVPAPDAIAGHVAPQQAARVADPDRALGPARRRTERRAGEALDLAERQAITRERGVELAHRGVGHAGAGLPAHFIRPGSHNEMAGT